ncbi:hypothetical protein [Longitalea luteola]|uniref:hypothetical protein n=1 Tax=Longitalea luteola TaxID=2812563 RepID=UPI001A96CC2A|nr:hypothetical protein [Longitalea luteola]
MAKSPKKKGNGKKKKGAQVSPVKLYAVSKGLFTQNPEALLKQLLKADRILPRLVLYKEDIIYLFGIEPDEANRLITQIRRKENTVNGRWVFIKELSRYTGVLEERIYVYLLSLTVKERILS